jgi:hypothetical protein
MVLSRDCDGCVHFWLCQKRFGLVRVGGVVSCPDGTRHLVDGGV